MTKLFKLNLLVVLLIFSLSSAAYAAEATYNSENVDDSKESEDDGYLSDDQNKEAEANMPMWLGFGIRAGGGANILFTPKDASPVDIGSAYMVAPFGDGGGGAGGGGGVFIESRWFKGKFGLDISLFNERNRIWCDEDVNGISGNKFTVTYSIIRIPILFEFHKIKPLHRFSLGLGPEFAIALDSTDVEIESDIVLASNNEVKMSNDVMIALDLGWGMKFGDWVLGLDFKTAFNATAPMDYDERVSGRPAGGGYTFLGSHTLDMRLLLSFMYEIGIGSK